MSDPTVIAHRGFAGVAPENTVRAFAFAIERTEATMVELDVQPAADGTPVVFHDERLEGDHPRDGRPLTNREGPVREQPLETIREAEVLESGETVPTLERILDALPASAGVNVELKNPGIPARDLRVEAALTGDERDERREVWDAFVERVVADCDAFGGEILFSSFAEGAIAAARDVAPEYAVAPLVERSPAEGLEIARRYDCEAIHPSYTSIVGDGSGGEPPAETAVDAGPKEEEGEGENEGTEVVGVEKEEEGDLALLEAAHAEGRTVNAWTVENWVQFDRLADAGVDGIVARYPGLGGCHLESSADFA